MTNPYIVQNGDTLYAIAKAHGVTTGELLAANAQLSCNGRKPNLIFPGDRISVPLETKFSKDTDLKRGRQNCPATCPSAVRFFDPSADQRCRWNPMGAVPWKTLVSGETSQVNTEISPPTHFSCVKFESTKPDVAKVNPSAASSATQSLVVRGLVSGDAEIRAVCDGKTIGAFPIKVLAFSLPLTVAQSARRPGLNADGTVAADMLFGDLSKERIRSVDFLFKAPGAYDLDTVKASTLFADLRLMATLLFATGELETNISAMIDRFERNIGGTYSNAKLTEAVRRHPSTKAFIEQHRRQIVTALEKHKGDVDKLSAPGALARVRRPAFSEPEDIVSGLTIAINDTWAYDVSIQEYRLSGDRCFSGKFKVVLYDHFGLDKPDVDDSKPYRVLAGFRAWFILQHLTRFAYQPFVTEVALDGYAFDGCFGQ